MVGCLIFIAGLVTGGGIAVILLSCLQINRIDKYSKEDLSELVEWKNGNIQLYDFLFYKQKVA